MNSSTPHHSTQHHQLTQHRATPVRPKKYSLQARATAKAGQWLNSIPRPLLRLLPTVENSSGDRLDPQIALSLKILGWLEKLGGGGFTELPLDKGRALIDDEALMGGGRPEKVGSAREYRVDGVRVREYRPAGVAMDAKLPTLIYLHGGGWVLGSLDSHDATARYLCNRVGAAVLSVDYQLAPENPYPAGLDDVLKIIDAAQRERIDGVDTERIAVGGDSAGGNLTAAACLRLRDEGKPQPVLQVLFVPVTDLTRLDRPSYEEFADGYFLTAEQMRWYIDHYTPDPEMREQPYASPLLAEDLSGLAPAYVAVDGFDPLRDEGEEYARRLTAAGVPTTLRRHGELVHPFVNSLGVWPNARRALDEAVGALRLALQAGGAV